MLGFGSQSRGPAALNDPIRNIIDLSRIEITPPNEKTVETLAGNIFHSVKHKRDISSNSHALAAACLLMALKRCSDPKDHHDLLQRYSTLNKKDFNKLVAGLKSAAESLPIPSLARGAKLITLDALGTKFGSTSIIPFARELLDDYKRKVTCQSSMMPVVTVAVFFVVSTELNSSRGIAKDKLIAAAETTPAAFSDTIVSIHQKCSALLKTLKDRGSGSGRSRSRSRQAVPTNTE
ncbi:hypothetical protein HDU76_007978, partial [Blyttiomyces sp. JEL0837]